MTYGAWETNQMGESFSNNSGKIEKRRISLEEFFFFFRKTFGQKPHTNLLLLLLSLKIAARAFFPLLGSGMISSSSVQKNNNTTTIQFQNGKILQLLPLHFYTLTSVYIFSLLLSIFLMVLTRRIRNNQSFLGWWSLPFFLMIIKNDSPVRLYGEIKRWSLFGFKGLMFNLTKRIYKPSNRVFLR